jgi:hypothetical protein
MSGWNYWGVVSRNAVRETFSHARRKLLLGLMLSIIAFLLQWKVLHLRNWTDTEKIITSLLGAALIVMAVSFLKNLLMGPVLLHGKHQSEINALNKQLCGASTDLAQAKAAPSVSGHEQEQQRLVSEKMADFTPEEAKVIEALLHHGEIHRRDVNSLGFSVDLFYKAVDKGRGTTLVRERDERHSGGREQYLSINPVFESALQHYFQRQVG